MKYTIIKRTGLGHNIANTCHYIGDDKSLAHNLNDLRKHYRNQPNKLKFINKHCIKRNLALAGIGVRTCGWKYTAEDFKALSKKKPHNKVKTLNIVISPTKGSINPYNLNQIEAFKTFCIKYIRTTYPNHLAYVAIQHDNTHGITHAHLIISALSTLKPYNTLSGNKYEAHYLRRTYNRISKPFNQEQHTIDLGPALTEQTQTPSTSQTDKWLIKHSRTPLNNLILGKDHNRTDLKEDFKKHGIKIKITSHRHRKHNNQGNVIYRKYKSGDKAGQFIYRKNRNGNKVKVPEYSYTTGVTLAPLRRSKKQHKNYVNGSRLAKLAQDDRFNGQYMLTVLYEIKKGSYSIPQSAKDTATSESSDFVIKSSASEDNDSKIQSSLAIQQASQAAKRSSESIKSQVNSWANDKSKAAEHNRIIAHQYSDAKNNLNKKHSSIINYYAKRSLAATQQQPNPQWLQIQRDYQSFKAFNSNNENQEAQRVTKIMPKFSTTWVKKYAAWAYQHSVPSYAVNQQNKVPQFKIKGTDNTWLTRLLQPIIKDFRSVKIWAYQSWTAGVQAIKKYLQNNQIGSGSSLITLAKQSPLLNRLTNIKKTRKFHHLWPKIKNIFKQHIAKPISEYLRQRSTQNSQAIKSSIEFSQSKHASLNYASNAKSKACSQIKQEYHNHVGSIYTSDKAWQQSFALDTSIGNYAKAANENSLNSADHYLAQRESQAAQQYSNHLTKKDISRIYAPARKLVNHRIQKSYTDNRIKYQENEAWNLHKQRERWLKGKDPNPDNGIDL